MADESLFNKLSQIDVSEHVNTKGKGSYALKYLSWVWAWDTIKRIDPDAKMEYTLFQEYDWKNHQLTGRKVDYCKTDTGTYVECTVTIKGHIESETLFVMDLRNKAVLEPTQDQINKAKQRCFVKACALQGLGLYIYAGEDLPRNDDQTQEKSNTKKPNTPKAKMNLIETVAATIGDKLGGKASEVLSGYEKKWHVDFYHLTSKQADEAQVKLSKISEALDKKKEKSAAGVK